MPKREKPPMSSCMSMMTTMRRMMEAAESGEDKQSKLTEERRNYYRKSVAMIQEWFRGYVDFFAVTTSQLKDLGFEVQDGRCLVTEEFVPIFNEEVNSKIVRLDMNGCPHFAFPVLDGEKEDSLV